MMAVIIITIINISSSYMYIYFQKYYNEQETNSDENKTYLMYDMINNIAAHMRIHLRILLLYHVWRSEENEDEIRNSFYMLFKFLLK